MHTRRAHPHAPFAPRMPLLEFALAALLAACAGEPSAFSTRYPDNRDHDIELLLQRVGAAAPRAPGSIAVALTSAPLQLYAFDLASRQRLWQHPVAASSAPVLAGSVAVLQAGDTIRGFELKTGAQRFELHTGQMTLKGADGEGDWVVLAVGQGQGTFAKSEVVLVHGGSVLWRRALDSLVGVPAMVGNVVLVPWSNQFLSGLDAQSGRELARVRVHDGVISHALREDNQVYIGSFHGITRVSASIGSGTLKGAGHFSLPAQDLPGRPLLLSDVYTETSPPPPDSAQHRIGLAWRPIAADRVRIGLSDDNLYLVFYRFVFALKPSDYAVRWVYVHDTDVVGATAQPHGLAFADEGGHFGFLAADSGELAWKVQAGAASSVAALPAGGVNAADGGRALDPAQLPTRLLTAAQDTDARMVPARLLCLRELARLPQAEATADLIELCDSTRLAPAVRENACSEIKQRTLGADFLLKALERHAAFLEGTTSPPVGALAKAAASLKEKRAVGLLVAHLKDPGTRSSDLPALVSALAELGDPTAAEPLAEFLRLYHADAADEDLVKALELVPQALLKLSGPVTQPVLESVTYDELGALPVRQKARIALDSLGEQRKAAESTQEQQELAEAERVAEEVKSAAAPEKVAPESLTLQVVDQALLPVHDRLLDCLKQQKTPTFQARVLLAVDEGQVVMVSVLPKPLEACIEPLIRAQKFPKTRVSKREQLTYTIKR